MELKIKKTNMFIISLILISLSLILFNGCKKSEPEPNSAAVSGNEMGHSEMAMEGMENMPTESVTMENGQTTCPVMKGNPINPNIYVEYQGKKVYFCCAACKDDFSKNPEKYIPDLPQFKEQNN